MEYVNLEFLGDCLTLGGVGFVVGVVLPLGFRLIGYVVDSVKLVLRYQEE